MNTRVLASSLAILLLSGLIATALTGRVLSTDLPAASASERAGLTDFETAFAQAARTIEPSVVSITSTRTVIQTPFGGGSPLGELFGNELPQLFGPHGSREFKTQALGSGVIVDTKGHVLTNNHVVAGADDLRVQLGDGRNIKASMVGTDPKTDLAVIKIEADGLKPAQLASPSDVRVGRWVLAVGSPYGLDKTVTAGIISARGRAGIGIADYEDLIQTDAAINRGNSGGPLINLDGQVVGITTAIISPTGGNEGIGFAIPVGMADIVMRSLIDNGEVVRGWLGAWIQSLTPDLAATFDYDRDYGVLVGDVVKGGPAAAGGLKSGDIIMEIDGQRVNDAPHLRNRVAETPPGSRVTMTVWRDGKQQTLEVTLQRLPEEVTRVADHAPTADNAEKLGVTFVDLTSDLRQRLGLPGEVQGAVVASVSPAGRAFEAGLRVGDVVTRVHGKPVAGAAEVRQALHEADLKRGVRLRVRSGDSSHFVLIKE
jgi:serine protease Do